MSPPRLLLIDDHTLFRTGLRMVLANGLGEAEFNEASSLEEAMRADMPPPDIVLLDIQLQGVNGLDGMALMLRRWAEVPVLILSSDTSGSTVRSALDRGARAFASKADGAEHILGVIRQLLRGEAPSTPRRPRMSPWPPMSCASLHASAKCSTWSARGCPTS